MDKDTTVEQTEPATPSAVRKAALAAERKKRILDAARELHQEKRFEKIAVENIARNAGMSVGGVYLYFASKEAIFAELVKERLAAHADPFELALDYLPVPIADVLRATALARAA